jgi:hypothetical protein
METEDSSLVGAGPLRVRQLRTNSQLLQGRERECSSLGTRLGQASLSHKLAAGEVRDNVAGFKFP